ncbi:MAG: hypothetical protein LUG12_13805 [Erysipelotrichaceae bacterium]|nr:hypothetical protein [Erysipelotrichaceae bacterium]
MLWNFIVKKNHRKDLQPLKRLINLYGNQWQDAQFKVLDELSQLMNKESLNIILQQIDCLPYQIILFLENHMHSYDEYYKDYEDIMKKMNLQMYIYYLEDYYLKSTFYCYDYNWIIRNLEWKFQGIDSKEIKEEFVYDMIQKRPNDEKFHYALLEFLKEVET